MAHPTKTMTDPLTGKCGQSWADHGKMGAVGAMLVLLLVVCALADVVMGLRHESHFRDITATPTIVHGGDSLWTIAEEHGVAGESTQSVVAWISANNDLTGSALQPGQKILVPA